jgi:hypothetical protein
MTEQDIIKLGFERNDVTAEQSGYENDWYYYTYDFVSGLGLITPDNEEANKTGWFVEFFDTDDKIRFTNVKDVEDLIWLLWTGARNGRRYTRLSH